MTPTNRTNCLMTLLGVVCVAVAFICSASVFAGTPAEPVGYWITIDDQTKKPKAVVRIAQRGEELFGRIERLIEPEVEDPNCDLCEGSKKGKRIIGLEILWGLKKDGEQWTGGNILDPENGKEYRCLVQVQDGGSRLKVRGYIGVAALGRTQYWQRTQAPK